MLYMEMSTEEKINTENTSNIDSEVTGTIETGEVKLSKRKLRRLRKREKWLEHKAEIRAREKEKKRQRKREAIARGEAVGPTRKMLKKNTMAKSSCQICVAIDCSFDKYMSEKDIMKLVKQIQFCYSSNRRADNPLQYYICGVHGQTKQRLEAIGDFVNWDVNFTEKNYDEAFSKENIVYLSSESPNILTDLDPNKAYIIGGLVDHNHHKGLCHKLAEEKGMSHAQLPISDYIDMKTRKVLTINHVFDILLRFTETKDWQEAFCRVLPPRKGITIKDKSESEGQKPGQTVQISETDTTNEKFKSDSNHDSDDSDESEPLCNTGDTQENCSEVRQNETVKCESPCGNTADIKGSEFTDHVKMSSKPSGSKTSTVDNAVELDEKQRNLMS